MEGLYEGYFFLDFFESLGTSGSKFVSVILGNIFCLIGNRPFKEGDFFACNLCFFDEFFNGPINPLYPLLDKVGSYSESSC